MRNIIINLTILIASIIIFAPSYSLATGEQLSTVTDQQTGDATNPPISSEEVKIEKEVKEQRFQFKAEIIFYIIITLLYIAHISVAWDKEKNTIATSGKKVNFSQFKKNQQRESAYLFVLATLLLPLAAALLSIYFGEGGIWRESSKVNYDLKASHSLFYFAKSVFILMITLEMSYLLNLKENYWQGMLTGALILDFIAYVAFTLIGPPTDINFSQFYIPFVTLAGFAALSSSLLTIYHTRLFDMYSMEVSRIKTTKICISKPE